MKLKWWWTTKCMNFCFVYRWIIDNINSNRISYVNVFEKCKQPISANQNWLYSMVCANIYGTRWSKNGPTFLFPAFHLRSATVCETSSVNWETCFVLNEDGDSYSRPRKATFCNMHYRIGSKMCWKNQFNKFLGSLNWISSSVKWVKDFYTNQSCITNWGFFITLSKSWCYDMKKHEILQHSDSKTDNLYLESLFSSTKNILKENIIIISTGWVSTNCNDRLWEKCN